MACSQRMLGSGRACTGLISSCLSPPGVMPLALPVFISLNYHESQKTAGRGKPAAVRDGTVLRKAKTESGGSLIEQEGLAVDQSPDDVFISNLFVLFIACNMLQGFLELFGCGSGCRGEEEQFGDFFSIRSGITGE